MPDGKLDEIYYKAYKMGIPSIVIPTIPEKDSWEYKTTRNG